MVLIWYNFSKKIYTPNQLFKEKFHNSGSEEERNTEVNDSWQKQWIV